MEKIVNLYIVRHGETEYNTKRMAQGWCDSPLTEGGRAIAARLGQGIGHIEFDCAYSSDLGRAKDTTDIILKNAGAQIPHYIDDRLRERGMGSLEHRVIGGSPWDGARKKAEDDGYSGKIDILELCRLYDEMEEASLLEPIENLTERLKISLDEACHKAEKGCSNILVVSHGLAILAMIYAITGDKYVPDFILNASVTLIENKEGVYHIKKVNDVSYIQ